VEKVEAMLAAAFLSFFGDPAVNPHAYASTKLEELFPRGEDGVKCGPFGTALKRHEYVASGVPVWTMDNIGANEFLAEPLLFVTPDKYEELATYAAQNGDILVSRAGTVGKMAVVTGSCSRAIIHTNLIRLRLDQDKVLPVFLTTLMTHFSDRVGRLKRGQEDAYTFMSTGGLAELRIPLPPMPHQQRFGEFFERYARLRSAHRELLRQAEHLFQTLLHRAFSAL
jgi:type I restriction enzyme S subunit